MRPVDVLLDYLNAQKAGGKTHILLDDEARGALRELYIKTRDTIHKATPKTASRLTEPIQTKRVDSNTKSSLETQTPAQLKVVGETREERLISLQQQAKTWAPAISLGSLRNTMVFAAGNPRARLMLIGEAPGHEEERRAEPFVGPAGRKLNDILKAMGLSREEVYISNIVKFRPSTQRQTINNRKPTPQEMESCLPFVLKEIEIVKPDCIVALGDIAAEGLLKLGSNVGSMREKWYAVDGIPTRVSYHPSHLLGNGSSNDLKRQVWEDMLAVMDQLGLPISDTQRSYFLPKS